MSPKKNDRKRIEQNILFKVSLVFLLVFPWKHINKLAEEDYIIICIKTYMYSKHRGIRTR